MTWRHPFLALAAAAIAACQSSGPMMTGVASSKVASDREPVARPCAAVREKVDGLLESAQEAALSGALDELRACDSAILQTLGECGSQLAGEGDAVAYAGQVLDELGRLAELAALAERDEEALASGEVDEELHPEPLPVAEERVAKEQAIAREIHFDLPVIVNAEVTSLIEYFSGPFRDRFAVAMGRAGHYLPFIREELRKARIPEDLAYLPFVESAFNPRARSRARAQGLWQFIAGTARLYDLDCDRLVDERNDPYLATRAAIAHLAELGATFGRWELALAAYNSGPGRVQRALRRARGSTDFWTLRRFLPRETRNYVPALWAVLVIVKNPGAYGFPDLVEKPDCLGRVPVAGALDIEVLAEHAKLDVEELADLNPALTHRLIPARRSYSLAVPCGREEEVARAVASIPPDERVRNYLHVVQRGDTLASIARQYGSSADVIASANQVRNPRSLRIGQTLMIPRLPGAVRSASMASRASHATPPVKVAVQHTHPPKATTTSERYKVRRGDTLFEIARRFNTSVAALRRQNGLPNNLIHPGDVLLLAR